MAPRRKRSPARRTGSLEQIPSITPERLATGWAIAHGGRIRAAAAGEADQVLRLWEPLGIDHEPQMLTALRENTIGWMLPAGLRDGQRGLITELGTQAATGELVHGMIGLSTVLVAQSRDGHLVGALHALPPGGVLAQVVDQGVPLQQALIAALALIKIRALAVDEHARGQGVGAALLHRCLQLYFRLGYYLAYGSFRDGSGLERYYSGLGFDIAAPGEGISLSLRLGLPFGISPEPGECLFSRWR